MRKADTVTVSVEETADAIKIIVTPVIPDGATDIFPDPEVHVIPKTVTGDRAHCLLCHCCTGSCMCNCTMIG